MRQILYSGLIALSAVFVVVDPVAAVPFFLAMTSEVEPARRRLVARRAAYVTWLVLTGFAVAGAALFRALGISLPAFKIAGGVLLLIMAVDMLQTRASEARITEGEVQAGARKEDIAVVPLAMPLLAGPGSIATVVVLMSRARTGPWWDTLPVLVAVLITAVATYLILAGASRVDRVLGHTGMNILQRVAGLLLAAIAIQFMLDGLGDVVPQLLHRA
ncbi:MAG TPA: MarC family protein [Anaeromyxobacteraceae bacterium]|nr:MarC family protein [Anaeromyxobacteraceae bacterium]